MTRDEGPAEDELLEREPSSPDEPTRDREQSVVPSDGAHDGESRPGMPSKRRAQGTDSDAQDTCTKPEAWIDTFSTQCTPDLRDSLYDYALWLLSGARTVSADSSAAQDLVQAAFLKMLNGPDHWDFAGGQKLELYLKNVIRRQVLADFERAKRLPHVSIEELTAGGELPEPDELEQALRHHHSDPSDVAYARSKLSRLRHRAAGHADVLAVIDAKMADRTERADVMEVTGLSPQRYRTAVSQLNRMAHEIEIEPDLITSGED